MARRQRAPLRPIPVAGPSPSSRRRRRWSPGLVAACAASAIAAAPAAGFDGAFVLIDGGGWDVDNGPVEFSLEPSGSDDVEDGSDLEAVRTAFRAWACVPGTRLRFAESETPGVADIADDGVNTVFWDETGDFGLGPGVLGVTVGDAGQGTRASADIVFNGTASEWSTDDRPTATDIGSIAAHEIGHFLGLDHPCDFIGGGEQNCNGPDRSIMTPAWDGLVGRVPLPDDEEGVRALYPADEDESGCEGPFRKGEACACDDECITGLVCAAPPGGGRSVCTETCASDDSDCGTGFACVLDLPEGDDRAEGVCVKAEDGALPSGSVCINAGQCQSGTCALLFDVARSLCQETCEVDGDCTDGRRCYEGFCLGGVDHDVCPVPDPGCACASSSRADSAGAGGLLVMVALCARRRRPR